MIQLPFFWVDAFTDRQMGGNPCAVILDAESLSSEKMQAIAKEMNLSETAFVVSTSNADFGARYFTPEGELPFAGHPTIATIHALIEAKRLKLTDQPQRVLLELPAGIIPIEIIHGVGKAKVVMSQLTPKFLKTYDTAEICAIYGIEQSDLLAAAPIQTVSTGTPILIVPLANRDALKKVRNADFARYEKMKAGGDFYFAHHFCLTGATAQGATFARSLGTLMNPLEDPFTGSATGCMAAYLWKYRLISSPRFIAEQGHWLGRPGTAEVEIIGTREDIQTVRVAGSAVVLVSGKINLES